MSAAVFVSYRRGDVPWAALSVANAIRQGLSHQQVFMDVDLVAGEQFPNELRRAVDACRAMVVVIGPNWNKTDSPSARARLLNSDDWVRREVELAISGSKKIFPIYIGPSARPDSNELPDTLHPLLQIQDYGLSEPRYFEREMRSLMDELVKVVGHKQSFLRRLLPTRQPQPKAFLKSENPQPHERGAYGHISGAWHEYHVSFDPLLPGRLVAQASIKLSLDHDLNILGDGHFPTQTRRILHYSYSGKIRGGNLFYTAVCIEDPSDAYCALYSNLMNNLIVGSITGLDYDKRKFVSPIVLSKNELSMEQAHQLLATNPPLFFSDIMN